jgi:hypothetical protein
MVVFELPATREGGALRAVALGSCRVKNPMFVLRDHGDLRVVADGPTPTHTAEEAAQSVAFFTGERSIPEELNQFIFEYDHRPTQGRLAKALHQPTDVYVLEISDDKQFSFRDVCLNQNFVSRHFVQPHRGALLDWYREIARNNQADEDCVQAALGKLREGGYRHDEDMAELLRGIRLDRREIQEIVATVESLMKKRGGQWLIVGPFTIPGDKGAVMAKRREFNQALKAAAAGCGAHFFNPTKLIKEHGKDGVLDGGVSIYEYEESFYPTLGRALIKKMRSIAPTAKEAVSPPNAGTPLAPLPLPEITRSAFAMKAEAKTANFAAHLRRWVRKIGRGLGKLVPRRKTAP